MAAAKSSRVNRQYKKKYSIRNWREYERGLRSRGDVTIWLSEDAIAAWVAPKNGLRGGQRRYSNLAVRTALTLRVVFSLPLRQTEGFLDSLLRLMGLNLKAPDHTTLSRRNQIVAVPPLSRAHDGPIDLIVDSTGLKILGCGEWNAHKHKASKKRRDWRKLHIGVDACFWQLHLAHFGGLFWPPCKRVSKSLISGHLLSFLGTWSGAEPEGRSAGRCPQKRAPSLLPPSLLLRRRPTKAVGLLARLDDVSAVGDAIQQRLT